MITDRDTITEALAFLTAQDIFLWVSKEEAQYVCPEPSWAIHVVESNGPRAVAKLKKELAGAEADGLILFVRGAKLQMADLEAIDAVLPRTKRFARGLDFSKPWGDDVEIWVFGE
jgi:hypothetical protein